MYHGVYEGTAATAQRKKILILGESHHGDRPEDAGKPGDIPTSKVVQDYLDWTGPMEDGHRFFHQIALSFGIDVNKEQERALFWDKVYFGNYVDVLCGIKDGLAKTLMEQNEDTYNQTLSQFVNRCQIDTIFCFGIQVFDHLPGNHYAGILLGEDGSVIADKRIGKNGNLEIAGYLCEPSPKTYDHPVRIYGMMHPAYPSFSPKPFAEYLKPVFEDCCG